MTYDEDGRFGEAPAIGARAQNYESHGPNGRIRGGARQVSEKYLELARDAYTGNDPVAAENFLQHAEHYFRMTKVEPSDASS